MPRQVRVSTISWQRNALAATVDQNLAKAQRLLELACATKPDIVCLPETFSSVNVPGRAADLAESVPGPTTDMAAAAARRHGSYVICPLLERRGDRVYNVAALLDRRGQIVGTYEKVHPVTSTADYTELESGVTPGAAAKVFETDLGRIGILICFDLTFPAEWAAVHKLGAELVFWPSAYNGGFPLRAFASLYNYNVATAVQSDKSCIIDITGEMLAESNHYTPIIEAQLDLEKKVYHTDFNASQLEAIRAKYGRDVLVRVLRDENWMTIESRRQDLTVSQIEAEFALERLDGYRARNQAARDALAAGETPRPQQTRYMDHAIYV
ncbi:MAG: carbon-nitrogen hydrolase family protein [Chloroflexi bacterium]|nr:carbon-nitrogen hydrolase family protein [Chloroflexota bacterium]